MIGNLEEKEVRNLAIRVLSRGVGSVEFIQSQLIEENDNEERTNIYGSPMTIQEPGTSIQESQPSTSEVSPSQVSTSQLLEQATEVGMETEPNQSTADAISSMSTKNSQPHWCKCGNCRNMSTAAENVCCKKKDCVTTTRRFYKLCLDPDVVQIGVLNRADIRNDPLDNSTSQFRKAAYRHFILDKYGYLGRGNRRVVPSCVVWKIRTKYPSPTGVYMGFMEN